MRIQSTTRGFGSIGRYVQGPGEFNNLAEYIGEFGKSAYAIIDGEIFEEIKALLPYDQPNGVSIYLNRFQGEVTHECIDANTKAAGAVSPACVIGIGGGKTIDAAKAIAARLRLPALIVPTIASTDAPAASMSAIFDENGTQTGILRFAKCPDIIIVDTDIIVKAPARYFSAGIGDALATCCEAKASALCDNPNFIAAGYRPTLAGMAICEACEKTVWEKAVSALQAVEHGLCTPDVEDIIEANTLLSGLGFLNVGLCGAHATNTGLTILPQTKGMLHGELVAFGVIVQYIVEQRSPEEMHALLGLLRKLRLPVTFKELGIEDMTQDMLDAVAKKAAAGFWTRYPKFVGEKDIRDVIRYADALGCEYAD